VNNSSSAFSIINNFKNFFYNNSFSTLLNNFIENDYYCNLNLSEKFLNEVFSLRQISKNLITHYNSIQKVFHSRYDELRSLVFYNDFSNIKHKWPIINDYEIKYNKLLTKNYKVFFNKSPIKLIFNEKNYYTRFNNLNFNFPFLLANKSDSGKNIWIDWFSKWSMVDIQPSSSSKYSIIGLPLLNKGFDFSNKNHKLLIETENYFLRLNQSRTNTIQ
jgi:hypothetical protein